MGTNSQENKDYVLFKMRQFHEDRQRTLFLLDEKEKAKEDQVFYERAIRVLNER